MFQLPSLQNLDLDEEGCSLWPLILSAETEAPANRLYAKYNDDLAGARVLGFFVLDFWERRHQSLGIVPYTSLVREINCNPSTKEREEPGAQHEIIYKLGLFYRNHLMYSVRTEGHYPLCQNTLPPILGPGSRPNCSRDAGRSKTNSDAKKHALARDGYQCVLTGDYDFDSCTKYPELDAKSLATVQPATHTQVAHIFLDLGQGTGTYRQCPRNSENVRTRRRG
ncbi:hypothetical protein DFH09DRAFT_113574 [Mycena vulgaris]|nr:hypothetical protein DFH09DRAFT_113574 [Mycena vulgaris]